MSVDPLLSVRISAGYDRGHDVLRDFELDLSPGGVMGLVGRSGSGKSTVSLAIMRLLWMKGGLSRGTIRFRGVELTALRESEMRRIRGKELSLVLQSPVSALNPSMRIGAQFREAWKSHAAAVRGGREKEIFGEMLGLVNLSDLGLLDRYPGEVSVGQAQRLVIAMAILHRPALLIADEPTSALDAITRAEILDLFSSLNRTLGMAILYISHDLASVASLCGRVAILHEGQVVECDESTRIFSNPRHPYTRQLVGTLPRAHVWIDNAYESAGRCVSDAEQIPAG